MGHDGIGIWDGPIHNLEPTPILYVALRFNETLPLVVPLELPQHLNVLWQRSEDTVLIRWKHFADLWWREREFRCFRERPWNRCYRAGLPVSGRSAVHGWVQCHRGPWK